MPEIFGFRLGCEYSWSSVIQKLLFQRKETVCCNRLCSDKYQLRTSLPKGISHSSIVIYSSTGHTEIYRAIHSKTGIRGTLLSESRFDLQPSQFCTTQKAATGPGCWQAWVIGECVVVGSLKSIQAVNLESPQMCDQILWKLSNVLGQHIWSDWRKWTEINLNQES